MQPRHADDPGVARVGPTGVGPERALEPPSVVGGVEKGVVPRRIDPELGVVALRGEHQRRAARPAPHQLGREQLLFLVASGLSTEVLAVFRDPGLELAEDDVAAVATEHLGLGHRWQPAALVRVAQDELARFERFLARIGARVAAALDGRVADAVLESERGSLGRQHVGVLAPDRLDAGNLPQGVEGTGERGLQAFRIRRQCVDHQVDVRAPERRLPVLGRALAGVAQLGRPRGHALLELRREAGEGVLRHAQRLEALEAERHGGPGLPVGLGWAGGGGDECNQAAQQVPAVAPVVDAHENHGAGVAGGASVQQRRLDVVDLQADGLLLDHGVLP